MFSSLLLFVFLRRLFETVLIERTIAGINPASDAPLTPSWLAFFAALIFALHPVAVYGVAYLVQRTSLMATMFALLTWWLFMEGLIRNNQRWLSASALTYLLALLAKEHAIMIPAVSVALLFLLRKFDRQTFNQVWPTFLLYTLAAIFIVYLMQSRNILGNAYEPGGTALLSRRGIEPDAAYLLSILTQSFLYFKYLLLWLIPNTSWMSVNMLENFSTRLWTWPETAGLVGFILYPIAATRLLLQRQKKGLLGFAMLCPWLLFATEFSAIRIQEIFVLYRSYLWMPGILSVLPFLFQRVPARYAVAILVTLTLAITPLSWNRLTVFSNPVLLWNDALQLAPKDNYAGTGKIYLNRGVANAEQGLFPQAIQDFTASIKLIPRNSVIYNNRATAYRESGQFRAALTDYTIAIQLNPGYAPAYLGRAKTHEAQGDVLAALQDYAKSCQMGLKEACSSVQWK